MKEEGSQTEMPGLMLVRARGRQCMPRQEAKESNHTGKISFDTISLTMWGWTPWAGDKMSRAKSMTGSGRKPKSKLACGGSVRFSLWKGMRQTPETVCGGTGGREKYLSQGTLLGVSVTPRGGCTEEGCRAATESLRLGAWGRNA